MQELAMQDALVHVADDCEIINYSPAQEMYTFEGESFLEKLTLKRVIKKIRNIVQSASVKEKVAVVDKIRKQSIDSYRDTQLYLSASINYETLHGEGLPYDTIVCGSDQIWNPDYNIPSYFLRFAKEDQRKVIYAASIGKDSLTKLQLNTYAELMKGLDYISVREHSAKEILQPVAEQPITVVLDPTLLHSREYWEGKASESTKSYKNYVFCYFLDMTEEKVKAAKDYAEKRGCELIQIPYIHGRYDYLCEKLGGIMDSDVNPADFLKLIWDAECVLTDSFHAAVFSLLFQKEFWVFGRMAGNYNMNTRLDTLLSYFGAEVRMIRPCDLVHKPYEPLKVSEDVLAPMREISFNYLKKALE
ncbi:MAG: polysaccharide pyruvyl transferase family protein [Oscillospiraceae bacterium]|nr:polysaccharide pyruvyl transferase family protein [Oscillospiraceae bacterium]